MTLRPYQKKIISALRSSIKRNNKRMIMCAPTGSGKTIMFSYMVAAHVRRGGRVLILTHRIELLKQAGGAFARFNLSPETIEAGKVPDLTQSLHVAMIETLSRRAARYEFFIRSRTMIIIDEAHLNNFTKIFPYISDDTFVIGATATPYRKGKSVPALSEFYQDIIQEIDVPELLDNNFLTPARSYGVKIGLEDAKLRGTDYDTSGIYKTRKMWTGVLDNWERVARNTKTLLFASNVESSEDVCQEFLDRGYNARHIDGRMGKSERNDILRWFDDTPDAVLSNCAVLTCLSDDTEVLTEDGWKSRSDITLKTKVAQWDIDTQKITFSKPIHKHEHMHNSFMVKTSNPYLTINVTDDHDMIVKTSRNGHYVKEKAINVINKRIRIPVSGFSDPEKIIIEQEDITPKKKFISSNSYNYRKRGMTYEESIREAEKRYYIKKSMRYSNPNELTLDECRLIGFWLGDGSKWKSKDGGVRYSVVQSKSNMDVIEWLEKIMHSCNIDYSKTTMKGGRTFIMGRECNMSDYNVYSLPKGTGGRGQKVNGIYRLIPYLKKEGTKLYWGLNKEQFWALIEGLYYADGSHHKGRKYTGRKIISKYKYLLDLLQAISACRGIRSNIRKVKKRQQSKKQLYSITFKKRTEYELVNDRLQKHKCNNELVWCLTVDKGTLVTRNNGSVTIMGNTGFDQPDIQTIILYRATTSLPLFLQMCGRGSRLYPGKTHFNILDFGENINRLGFWEEPRTWSLEKDERRVSKEQVAPTKDCPECMAMLHASVRACKYCGHEFPVSEKEREQARLQELTYSEITAVIADMDMEEVEKLRVARGYKVGWVAHQLGDAGRIKEYAEYKGYKNGWVDRMIKMVNR